VLSELREFSDSSMRRGRRKQRTTPTPVTTVASSAGKLGGEDWTCQSRSSQWGGRRHTARQLQARPAPLCQHLPACAATRGAQSRCIRNIEQHKIAAQIANQVRVEKPVTMTPTRREVISS